MTLFFLFLFASIFWIILGTTRFKLHPFLVLLSASIFLGVGTGIPLDELAGILGKGMGKTMQSIGLLILFGTVIGVVLERSNATQSIANALLQGLAKLPLPYAVSCIGYLVAIPVFCDSAFVILSALNKRLSQQTKTPLVALTVALSTGLFAPPRISSPHARTLGSRCQSRARKPISAYSFWGNPRFNFGARRSCLCALFK